MRPETEDSDDEDALVESSPLGAGGITGLTRPAVEGEEACLNLARAAFAEMGSEFIDGPIKN